MNKFCTALCLLGLAAPFYNVEAAAHLESYLPENSLLLMSVSDYSDVTRKSKDSPVNDLFNDAKIREVLKPLTHYVTRIINEDSDKPLITFDEVKAHLDGQIVLSLDISKMIAEVKAGGDIASLPSVILLADLKDSEDFVDLLSSRLKDQEDDKESIGSFGESEKFQGVTIHHFIVKDDSASETEDGEKTEEEAASPDTLDIYFGTISDTFFLTTDSAAAHDVVEAVKGRETGTLAESEAFSGILAQTEDMDEYLYLNAKPLDELVDASIRKGMAPKEGEEPNPLKPTPDAVINATGMNSFKNVLVGVTFDSDNVRLNTNIAVDTSFGIGRLFRAYAQNYATPDFIPESAVSVNASGFNLGTLLVEARQIAFTASPMFAMLYQAQIGQLQEQIGIDFEKDLIGNFDDGLVCFTLDNPEAANTDLTNRQQIFALKIKDATSFKRSLDAVLAITPYAQKIERRDFSGTEIIVFNNDASTPVFAMAHKDGWLLMSEKPTTLQNAISSGDGKKSFWQSKAYDELGDGKLPAGGIGVTYDDFDALVKTLLYTVAKVYNESAPVASGEAQPIDVNLIGEIKDMPFSVCGKAYKTPEGIKADTYLIKK